MVAKWIETLTGPLEQKKQYREAKARIQALPSPYRQTADALNRYLTLYAAVTDGATLVQMHSDLADLLERAAADNTPVGDVVGDDPVDFAETFALAYGGKQWIDKERQRLIRAIEDAKRDEPQ
ncbi:DUF1048 domain-containing protein [Cumulibacter soli]|uniref:DUF1048 domain-containing protein n=1 Tax=Cumulibacter soli TaxID=2546344 RepID=UPI001068C70D|nr:DUF1048 domain-containing protein [Cumulibacter soli]